MFDTIEHPNFFNANLEFKNVFPFFWLNFGKITENIGKINENIGKIHEKMMKNPNLDQKLHT